jgi:acyl-coenzyme A synthetase/AMP-(fatty) acid ligase
LEQFKKFTLKGSPTFYNQLQKVASRNNQDYWNSLASHFAWTQSPKQLKRFSKNRNTDWFVGGRINYFDSLFKKKKLGDIAWIVYDQKGKRESLTYRQVSDKAKHLSNHLASHGFRPKQTVLILTEDPVTAALGALACLRIGVRFGYIYSKFPKHMIETLLKVTNPVYLMGDSHLLKTVSKKVKKIPITSPMFRLYKGKQVQSYSADATHPSFILFTSGTTDKPKALLSGTAGCHVASLLCGSLFYSGLSLQQTHWSPLDFAWGATLILGFLGPFYLGNRLVFDKRRFSLDSLSTLKIIKKEKIDSLLLAPSFLEKQSRLKSKLPVKKVVLGGDLMSYAAWTGAKHYFNSKRTRVINIYGSNECGSVMMFNFVSSAKTKNTMKRFPGVEIKIHRRLDSKIGTIHFKNSYPSLAAGQIGNSMAYQSLWAKGFLMSQDLAKQVGNHVDLLGRQGRLIKVKGRYVDLNYLEKLLIQSTPYRQFYFSSVTGSKKNFILFALGPPKHQNSISTTIKKGIGSYALPDRVIFVKVFPHNQSGKIDEVKLLRSHGIVTT